MGTDISIRPATVEDAAGILAVYAPYVEGTAITFETEVPRPDEFRRRVAGVLATYPYLVLEEDGRVVGYAYAQRIGERAAYAWNAELSVYLDPAHVGRGHGKALSGAVLRLLELQGVHNVLSLVTQPNDPSMALHRSLGFRLMGTQRRAGHKLGAWHDVAWLQKALGDFEGEPGPVVPIGEIDPGLLRGALRLAGA